MSSIDEVINGVNWNESRGQWVTTVKRPSGATTAEYHDCLLDAVACRKRFERQQSLAGGYRAVIAALELENQALRKRLDQLEFQFATSAVAAWQLH